MFGGEKPLNVIADQQCGTVQGLTVSEGATLAKGSALDGVSNVLQGCAG